jgi:hypothetical protein
MSTNSADPIRLHGYAGAVAGIVATRRPVLDSAHAAIAAFDASSPAFALDLGPIDGARDALHRLALLGRSTDQVADAFTRADQSGGPVRQATDTNLVTALASNQQPRTAEELVLRGAHAAGEILDDDASGARHTWGPHGNAPARADVGPISVDANGDYVLGLDVEHGATAAFGHGKADVAAFFSVVLGAHGVTEGTIKIGGVEADIDGETVLGAILAADGSAHLGLDGLKLNAKGDGFVGFRTKMEATVDAGPVRLKPGFVCSAGAGVLADSDTEVSLHKVRIDNSVVPSVGPSCVPTLAVEADPVEVIHWTAEKAKDGYEATKDFVDDAIDGGFTAGSYIKDHVPHIPGT